ncbi:MAG: glucose-6-phosphate dehydrogenase assembly protein OpcA [Singulisphaera sp.]
MTVRVPGNPRVVSTPLEPVDISAIERELTKLWKPPEGHAGDHHPLTRACMSNLIIHGTTREQAGLIPDELDVLVRHHPARVLLLVDEDDREETAIEAFVSARCHLSGKHSQVCSEHVTINASGDAVRRLPSVARSLLIGDLPTTLWWASDEAPPLGGGLFDELAAMSDQVIYSSQAWPDPTQGTLAMADWAGAIDPDEPDIADLSWGRLKLWRRLMSQSLDPAVLPGALGAIDRVDVEYGPLGLPQAWLLVGWLSARLGCLPTGSTSSKGQDTVSSFHSPRGPLEVRFRMRAEGEPEVRSVAVSWKGEGVRRR